MPKRHVEIVEASEKRIIMEGVFGVDGRISIPVAVRSLVKKSVKFRVTVEMLEGN